MRAAVNLARLLRGVQYQTMLDALDGKRRMSVRVVRQHVELVKGDERRLIEELINALRGAGVVV